MKKDRDRAGATKKTRRGDVLFGCLFFLIGLFLFWKCRYGFANRDEAFYLTIPYRLSQGDALFSEEWHLSQMAGVLLLPFLQIYLRLAGSTEGILLTFRFLCTAVWCASGVFLYICLKKYSPAGAGIAAVCFLLYIPFGIMALSYNSLGILNLLLSLTIAAGTKSGGKWRLCMAGIFFSGAVLCCPYLAFVYFIYSILAWRPKKGERKEDGTAEGEAVLLKPASWLFFSSGIFLSALLFLIFVFSRTTPAKLMEALPYLFRDPQHPARSPGDGIRDYLEAIVFCNGAAPLIYPGLGALSLILAADRRRMEHRAVYLTTAAGAVILLVITVLTEKPYLNFLMFPINILGLYCRWLSREERIRKLFRVFWIPGMLYSFCISLSSNQRFYAISSASAVAAVGSILMIALTGEELWRMEEGTGRKKRAAAVFLLVLTLQMGSEAVLRYNSVFWERSMKEQTCLLQEGPEAGLYVTPQKAELYETMREETEILRTAFPEGTVLFLSRTTWPYLLGEQRFGTYSAWLSGVNEKSMKRLEAYFGMNGEKMPDVVYADGEYEEQADWWCSRYRYRKEKTDRGFVLWKS